MSEITPTTLFQTKHIVYRVVKIYNPNKVKVQKSYYIFKDPEGDIIRYAYEEQNRILTREPNNFKGDKGLYRLGGVWNAEWKSGKDMFWVKE
jgi:hypothetical protein